MHEQEGASWAVNESDCGTEKRFVPANIKPSKMARTTLTPAAYHILGIWEVPVSLICWGCSSNFGQ